jgi:hypothetical protein
MYCNNSGCDSRETEVLIMRGHDEEFRRRAGARADVRALVRIDDGGIEGHDPLMEGDMADPRLHEEMEMHWITPGILEAMKPGRMQGHGGTEEVPG